MTAPFNSDDRADDSWNQCIACHGVRISRFFCRTCLDAGVDEELSRDNPILRRRDTDAASTDHRSGRSSR
ncbi:MAG: hypothetical protein WAL84_05680 [Candidatus Dormiibacterota bacterium]